MVMAESTGNQIDCRARLLCSRYAVVAVGAVSSPTHHALLCGLGFLTDGEWEALGVWSTGGQWLGGDHSLVADLQRRGLERIRLLVCGDLAAANLVLYAFPGAEWMPSMRTGPPTEAVSVSLPKGMRRVVAAAATVVSNLEHCLESALGRQRDLSDVGQMCDFAAALLHRAESLAARIGACDVNSRTAMRPLLHNAKFTSPPV